MQISGEKASTADTQQSLAMLTAQVRALRNLSMPHYRALAAKVLKRLVSEDAPRGQSFTYRHLNLALRTSIRKLVLPLGYRKNSEFSKLADEVTNLRNEDVHFNSGFEADVRRAQVDFSVLYHDLLTVPRVKVIFGLNLYDSFSVHFQ